LEAVQDHLEVPLPVDEYDTLSGFLVGQLGYIPSEDEKPEMTFSGVLFKVESVHEKRIEAVTVIIPDEESEDEQQ